MDATTPSTPDDASTPLARLERYLTGERSKSPATRAAYLADAQLLLELCGDKPLAQLELRDIRGFVRTLHRRGQDPRSIARRLCAWRAWFRLLMREAAYTHNPVEGIRPPRAEKKLPRPLNPDAMNAFLDHLPQDDAQALRDKAIYELLYSSGLRIAELAGLNLADFGDEGRVLTVTGKGGKMRQVPVGETARQALDAWLAVRAPLAGAGQALFIGTTGKRLSVRTIQKRLHDAGVLHGVPDRVHPHKLRHACASHFLQSSQDLRATQELLGHSSIVSTQVYTHLDFQHLAQVYDAAHPRSRKRDS